MAYSQNKSVSKSNDNNENGENDEEKEESVNGDVDEKMDLVKDRKRHFNYSPVDRTESAESIKVSYKPKQTFVEKWNCNEQEDDDDAFELKTNEKENNILSKLKKKSSRFLKLNHSKKKSQTHSYTNVQNPNIGLNDLQL